MRAMMYLTRRSLINNLKKAVSRPSTLIALIFGIAYGIFIIVSLGGLAASIRLDSVRGLVIVITVWSIYSTFGNFMGYSSRKGILFKPGHAHFVFTAPISPKLVLLNAAWMNYLVSTALWATLAIGGLTVFQVEPWKVLLFFLVGCVFELPYWARNSPTPGCCKSRRSWEGRHKYSSTRCPRHRITASRKPFFFKKQSHHAT